MEKGNLIRTAKSTSMNNNSSRSHAILTINLSIRQIIDGNIVIKSSKINFVDLAGSETLKKTHATGEAKKEASFINKSL